MELLVCIFLEILAFNQRICFAHTTQNTNEFSSRDTNEVHRTYNGAFLMRLSRCQEKRRLRDFELEKVTGAATTSISGVSTLHPPETQTEHRI
jgi:hypothetical protein